LKKKITLLSFLLIGMHSFSQIVNTAPYILTVNELKQWTTTGATASPDLIATVPLAERFTNTATQFNPNLTNDLKIAYLPDGMNNFGNYYGEQSQFNLFNFTHWAYIDKLVWFGGTASQTIQIPSSPWANAAHKNGVKIFGDVFFAPTAFGGSTATLTNFLEQDGNGNFVAIPRMIAIMQYYNFDGWFINQETATNSATAQLMYAFVRDLTAQAEAVGKEIMWYDAMILSGSVGWQNRLNTNNSPFVQRDADSDPGNGFETRVSSSIFTNFFWTGPTAPTASRTRATAIGRSSFDVFTGVDIWPGRNQGNFETGGDTFLTNLHEANSTTPITSLGIFAPNCVYNSSVYTNFNNDPADYASFYAAENHLFSGDDNNPATVDATAYKGLSTWVPEASVIAALPFETDFCTGHGTKKFAFGNQIGSDSWHDMNQQDILPTWQFGFSTNDMLIAGWDFDTAYSKGNSLKVSGNLPANAPIDLMLFKSKLNATYPIVGYYNFSLKYKSIQNNPGFKVLIVYADEPNQKYEFAVSDVNSDNGWRYGELWSLTASFPPREIASIGLRFESPISIPNYEINIGEIRIEDAFLGTSSHSVKNNQVTVSYPQNSNAAILFNINWPDATQLNCIVYDLQGKAVKSNTVKVNGKTNYALDTTGLAAGTYTVKFTDPKNVSETKKIIIR
jgi:endo-beta-N-acetylglucosaminidase D